jgi:hypothetical protein
MAPHAAAAPTIVGPVAMPSVSGRFDLTVDRHAKAWLDLHPEASQLFITYLSSRACCTGVRVCDVRVRLDIGSTHRGSDDVSWSPLGQLEGRDVFIDARLIERMPRRLVLTGRGIGRFRHLDLDLTGEQWAEVLYPT